MAVTARTRTARFSAFEVDLRSGELRKHGIRLKPVSYTHLDVYKRQVERSNTVKTFGLALLFLFFALPAHAQRTGSNGVTPTGCLLYTSRCV